MPHDRVALELQALQRGRGIMRPRVDSWLGEELANLASFPAGASDDERRRRLTDMLVDASQALTPDLRFLFLVASGIRCDQPRLKDRLTAASTALKREPRTMSRWLREAEVTLAARLTGTDRPDPFGDRGWAIESGEFHLDLRDDRPLATTTLRVRATRNQTGISPLVAIPSAIEGAGDLEIEAVSGCTLDRVIQQSERSWCPEFRLDKPVRKGQGAAVAYRVRFPDRRYLAPFAAFGPFRPCHTFAVTVDFGTPSAAERAWVLEGVPQGMIADVPVGATMLDLDRTPTVHVSFTDLRASLAYGLAWRWAT